MQYMKVNQVVSQRPIFSSKAKFPNEHNNNTRGGLANLRMQRTIENFNADV